MLNQISRLVATSGQVPTFGNEYQNQMAGLMETTEQMVGFGDQVVVTPFNSGSSASSTVMPNGPTQRNSIMLNQVSRLIASSSQVPTFGNESEPNGGNHGDNHTNGRFQ